jgi:hypothetical protein
VLSDRAVVPHVVRARSRRSGGGLTSSRRPSSVIRHPDPDRRHPELPLAVAVPLSSPALVSQPSEPCWMPLGHSKQALPFGLAALPPLPSLPLPWMMRMVLEGGEREGQRSKGRSVELGHRPGRLADASTNVHCTTDCTGRFMRLLHNLFPIVPLNFKLTAAALFTWGLNE